ncbi:RGS domain-containing protein [Blakeslea trispora]|nr:RGS domain-containing protein [Blakeslea trispora]
MTDASTSLYAPYTIVLPNGQTIVEKPIKCCFKPSQSYPIKHINQGPLCGLHNQESVLNPEHEHHSSFMLYLHHTFCTENYSFWQDVQDYRLNPTLPMYQAMIDTYIVPNAPQEINIPCEMRQDILRQFSVCCFDQAAESILELIRVNSFIPWYQENHFRRKSMATSISFPDRWNLLSKSTLDDEKVVTRPSFASLRMDDGSSPMLRTVSAASMFDLSLQSKSKSRISSLLQRKREALLVRVKRTFVYS